MFARLRQLVVGFFVYNLVTVVVSFHVFIDVCVSLSTAHKANKGAPSVLGGYERSAAAFLFFEFLLSMLACIFAVKAVDEARGSALLVAQRPLTCRKLLPAAEGQEARRVHTPVHRNGSAAVRECDADCIRTARPVLRH